MGALTTGATVKAGAESVAETGVAKVVEDGATAAKVDAKYSKATNDFVLNNMV